MQCFISRRTPPKEPTEVRPEHPRKKKQFPSTHRASAALSYKESSHLGIKQYRDYINERSCTIFRVSNHRRDDYRTYAPTVVTIGLFHSGIGESLSPQLHKHKSDCVSYLLARHGSKEKAEKLLQKCMKLVLTLEPRAHSCYSVDDGNLSRHEFAEMLLRDGCFILRLLLKQKKGESLEVDTDYMLKLEKWETEITVAPMIGRLWIWDLVVYDLIKLENQIPFFVLQELFDLLRTPADKNIDLVELALELFRSIYPARAKTLKPPPSSDVLHLLHLFHSSLVPPKLESVTPTEAPKNWIPSASVLHNAGIKFRPPSKRTAESFLEVTFEKGVMEIPPLQVDDFTSLVFHNLIAFEQRYLKTKTHITTYARCLEYLIKTTRDVQLLSLNGVLSNKLGTEEAAVDLLNKLCDQVRDTSHMNYLGKVFTDVTKYHKSPWHKWRALLFWNCFSNP